MNTTATATAAPAVVMVDGVRFERITDADALYPCWEGAVGANIIQVTTVGRAFHSTVVGPMGYYLLGGGKGATVAEAARLAL